MSLGIKFFECTYSVLIIWLAKVGTVYGEPSPTGIEEVPEAGCKKTHDWHTVVFSPTTPTTVWGMPAPPGEVGRQISIPEGARPTFRTGLCFRPTTNSALEPLLLAILRDADGGWGPAPTPLPLGPSPQQG